MSRPFTCLCLIMAASSGLYLYNSKHDAQVLDQEIARLTQTAAKSRASTDRLRSEYDHLSDPERLKVLAGQWLTLQPTDPKQFATLADVDKRLPAIGVYTAPQNELLAIAEPPTLSQPQPLAAAAAEKPAAAPVQMASVTRPAPSAPIPAPAQAQAQAPTPRASLSLPPLMAQSQAAAAPPVAPATQAASAAQMAQIAALVKSLQPHPAAEPKQIAQLTPQPPLPRATAPTPRPQPAPPPPTPPGLRPTPAIAAPAYSANEMVTRVAQKLNPNTAQPSMVTSSLGMARMVAQQPVQARP